MNYVVLFKIYSLYRRLLTGAWNSMPASNEIDYELYHLKSTASPTLCSLLTYGQNYTDNRCFHFACVKVKIHMGLGMISKWREGWSHGREGVEYGLHGKLVSVANSEG